MYNSLLLLVLLQLQHISNSILVLVYYKYNYITIISTDAIEYIVLLLKFGRLNFILWSQ